MRVIFAQTTVACAIGLVLLAVNCPLVRADESAADVAAQLTPADEQFFESKVRPILAARCYECHSTKTTDKGSLVLDLRAGWQRGGDSGAAIVPGKPEASLLIRAIEHKEPDYEMPPSGKLPAAEIAVLREWVKRGAPDPRVGALPTKSAPAFDLAERKKHWSFQPLRRVEQPTVKTKDWPRQASDYFVLAKLEEQQLVPAADTSPERFLRRLYYDLIGLPPTSKEVLSFAIAWHRDRDAAIRAAADQLLERPQFGEKWGRHWLDLARYADSNGSSFNPPYPMAWRYRNWVIDALNRDLPYNEFVTWQLAGDLIEENDGKQDERYIATGFLMLGSKVLGEFDKEQLSLDCIDEQLDTIGKALLGLTIGCARCHDHKFDPITQRDYYALAGIMASTVTLQDRLGGPKEDESDWSRRGLGPDGDRKLQEFLREHRYEWVKTGQKLFGAKKKLRELDAQLAALSADSSERERVQSERDKQQAEFEKYEEAHTKLAALLPPYAEAVRDAAEIRDEQLRIRGVPSARGDVIPRGFLSVLPLPGINMPSKTQSGRRELAAWVTSSDNPLTARVLVNRVWQKLFGEGIVRSVDNFGLRGELPTHPELLDYLATRFIHGGWKLKPLVRELVTSRAYRLATKTTCAAAVDPQNRFLWRQNKRRLEPEEIRDTLLLLSGELDLRPSDHPMRDFALTDISGKDLQWLAAPDRHRTIYLPLIRTLEPEILQVFDFANPGTVTGQRAATTVAPQALFFLNAPFVQETSRGFAERMQSQHGMSEQPARVDSLVESIFIQAISRRPEPEELRLLSEYLRIQFEGPPGPTRHDVAKLCQALLGSTQFQFLD